MAHEEGQLVSGGHRVLYVEGVIDVGKLEDWKDRAGEDR